MAEKRAHGDCMVARRADTLRGTNACSSRAKESGGRLSDARISVVSSVCTVVNQRFAARQD